MTKRIIRLLLLSVILFTFSCCNQTQEPDDNLHLTVAWNIYSENYGNERLALDSEKGQVYVNERGSRTIAAINIESGKLIWRTDEIITSHTNVVFDEKYIYSIGLNFPDKNTTNVDFIQLDKETGNEIKRKTLSNSWYSLPRMNSLSLYNGTLYWGGKDRHFMYAYSTTEEDGVRKIWGSEDVTSDIMGDIVPYNGRLYFVSSVFPYTDEPKPSYLISMNPDGSDIKKLKISADFLYVPRNRMQFYKDKLYLNGMYLICVNPKTMKIEWELRNSDGFFTAPEGFVINCNRIYAPDNGGDEDAFFCINAKNGKVVWKERINTSFYGSIFYSPVVYGGYVYQPAQDCMIVFNAENGKYAGRDERIRTGTLAVGITECYKNFMIFSGIHKDELTVYALKMDMHTR
ncbi:MAG: hypothetical protein J1G30_00925 [Spirochaetales bacterium]|nr:hypothetical protein [Spirochaetales bacterium]